MRNLGSSVINLGTPARQGWMYANSLTGVCSANTVVPVAQTAIPGMSVTFTGCKVGDRIKLITTVTITRTAVGGAYVAQIAAVAGTNTTVLHSQAPALLQPAANEWGSMTCVSWFIVSTAGSATVISTHGASNNADYTTLAGYSSCTAELYISS